MIILVRKYETSSGFEAEETFEFDSKEKAQQFKEEYIFGDGLGWSAYEGERIKL